MLESSATLPRCVGVRTKEQNYPISNAVFRPEIDVPHSIGSERLVLARRIELPTESGILHGVCEHLLTLEPE